MRRDAVAPEYVTFHRVAFDAPDTMRLWELTSILQATNAVIRAVTPHEDYPGRSIVILDFEDVLHAEHFKASYSTLWGPSPVKVVREFRR